MASKKQYYDIKNILSTKAEYLILLGQRANGKSYQAKKTVIEEFMETGKKFIYLRRWKDDIKSKSVEAYFGDMNIKKLTKGKYTGLTAWNGSIYFTNENDKGEQIKEVECGKYCALNIYERYKSWAFVNYSYIIYEEFITDAAYLTDEPRQLQQFVSTVARNEHITVILVGNTLSRVCPYFSEWSLDGVLKQKQGTIDLYHHHVTNSEGVDTVINIAVEYCANANFENKMFFGQTAKQIISGEWDTTDLPRLPRPQSDYEVCYEILIEYQKFKFVLQLLVEPLEGGMICYVYPHTKTREIYRKITDVFSDKPNITSRLDTTNKAESLISKLIALDKVCYSDNLTGTDFRTVITQLKL